MTFLIFNKELEDLSDEGLINEFLQKDKRKAIGILFQRYTHLVYAVCLKYLPDEEDAKDCVMQVFEKLFENLRPGLENFKGWLYTVTKNECLMKLRAEEAFRRTVHLPGTVFTEDMGSEAIPALEGVNLSSALEALDERQRKCIELFYLKNLSYREVSRITGFEVHRVKSYIQNGKRNLKNLITAADGQE